MLALLHAAPCCCQGSRCRERRRNSFYTAMVACARIKFSFQNYSQRPAITRRAGPESPAAARRHSGAMAHSRSLSHSRSLCNNVTHCDPSHSGHGPAVARPAVTHSGELRALLTRLGPSHSQRPAVHHHSPWPVSLAAARRHPLLPAARRHPPRAVTVVTRCGPPSLATARLNRRCPSYSPRPACLRWRHGPPSVTIAASLTQ